jgi:pimeloyl-ACP methyl ester carboxylesterase
MTADGVRIAWTQIGDGPTIAFCPWSVESFSLTELSDEFSQLVRALGYGRRLVRFDGRGTGLSERDVTDSACLSHVLDIAAVLDASGTEACTLARSNYSGH